ncbi:MAG TPA: AbrB/MazE/SpoVT family DNA-binding domain-containing protein [Nitrososphaerales archaeon]|nr:AbrB/MazE/SpoVT family DNA-binding domain-containing protein [Nitrososphaerales archaeon]
MGKGDSELEYKMRKTVAKAKKIGGSLMVRIPAEAASEEGIQEGDLVELQVSRVKKSWFGSYPGIGPMTREDELDTHD